ncbi:anti-repressor SinI family protein [Fictibacillus sp. BK138]|nr:anti-repressor SinI family protein [Fictibacillus sp. BK138]RZT21345.1 anti-repressor SinI [Fictibacillus sp. BK138]
MENTLTLDREWIELMKEARDHGFTKEEVINFLKNPEIFFKEKTLLKQN